LTSAYVSTAVMNAWPTSGPTATATRSAAREVASSRKSFRASQSSRFTLGERKEDVLEVSGGHPSALAQLIESTLGDGPPIAQEYEAVADADGIGHRMDGDHERPSTRGDPAEQGDRFPRLPEVESVERFVHEHDRLRSGERECDEYALTLPFRQRP